MDNFENRLSALQKRVLGNKTISETNETLLIFDAETEESITVDINLDNVLDDRELEFFFDETVRKVWHKQEEEWYFSIVDVCKVLTDSPNPQTYWRVLKKRLKDEGNETVTNCNALKMKAAERMVSNSRKRTFRRIG